MGPEEKEIRLSGRILFQGLWPHIRPYTWMLICSTLMVFLVIFFEMSIPVLVQKGLDGFILTGNTAATVSFLGFQIQGFQTFAALFCALILSALVIDFCQTLFMEYTGQKIIFSLRCALFAHMTGLPVSYYDENTSGRLVSRAAGDIENMNEMFTSVLVFIFKDLVLMSAIFIMLFRIHPGLAGHLFLLVPIMILCVAGFSIRARRSFRTIRQKTGEITHSFSEGISGIRIIQTTGAVQSFVRRFRKLNREHYEANMFQIRIFAVFMPIIGFLGVISMAIIIWVGSREVMAGVMTLGELVAFLTYMKLFFRPMRELSEKFNLLQNALASAERIVSVFAVHPDAGSDPSRTRRLDHISCIQCDRVSFSYTGREPVLSDISFDLKPGESIGIAGHTGSGKTTIINLITGFYSPDSGHILFNGISHDTLNIRDIRNRMALVMQDPVLFSGTIRDNISPPGTPLPDEAVKRALEQANCKFLYDKFQGPDTRLEEGGRPLSAGEKQLVCIARAFAFNPDVIIFDEATSYMDTGSEVAVHDAMARLMRGRLAIIIAHRLSTIRGCTRILLLADGRIREQGSHLELVAAKGAYFHLLEKEIRA